eukprot:TRINITY_DN15514_c0_g1_i16.p1 TRINITY_DN15514_c0_g1~~TRINITY_DN15514_c0_g1_i16.p1  ORF type:complete len:1201 (-),score=156.05 TRINITY_DN15514_c0_g1_i16:112-3192(-)
MKNSVFEKSVEDRQSQDTTTRKVRRKFVPFIKRQSRQSPKENERNTQENKPLNLIIPENQLSQEQIIYNEDEKNSRFKQQNHAYVEHPKKQKDVKKEEEVQRENIPQLSQIIEPQNNQNAQKQLVSSINNNNNNIIVDDNIEELEVTQKQVNQIQSPQDQGVEFEFQQIQGDQSQSPQIQRDNFEFFRKESDVVGLSDNPKSKQLFSTSCLQFMSEIQLRGTEGDAIEDKKDFLETKDFMDEYALTNESPSKKQQVVTHVKPLDTAQLVFNIEVEDTNIPKTSLEGTQVAQDKAIVVQDSEEPKQQAETVFMNYLEPRSYPVIMTPPVEEEKQPINRKQKLLQLQEVEQDLQLNYPQNELVENEQVEQLLEKPVINCDEEKFLKCTNVLVDDQTYQSLEKPVLNCDEEKFLKRTNVLVDDQTCNSHDEDKSEEEENLVQQKFVKSDKKVNKRGKKPLQKEDEKKVQHSRDNKLVQRQESERQLAQRLVDEDSSSSVSTKQTQEEEENFSGVQNSEIQVYQSSTSHVHHVRNSQHGRGDKNVISEAFITCQTAVNLVTEGLQQIERYIRTSQKQEHKRKGKQRPTPCNDQFKMMRLIGNNSILMGCQVLVILYMSQTLLKRRIQDPSDHDYITEIPKFIDKLKSIVEQCQTGLQEMTKFERQQSSQKPSETDVNDQMLLRMELIVKRIRRAFLQLKSLDVDGKVLGRSYKRVMGVQCIRDSITFNTDRRIFCVGECSLRIKDQGRVAAMYRLESGPDSSTARKKHGDGYYSFKNGDEYKGEFYSDRMEGLGVYTFSAGGQFTGEWRKSVYEGVGAETFARGSKFEGQYQNGLRHGYGTCDYYNGDTYVGQWFGGCRSGLGLQQCQDGSQYYGQYKNGKRQGVGVYTFPNGDRYMGQYENDLPHGSGVYEFSTGYKYQGQWQHGEKQGWCEYFVSSGEGVVALFDGNRRQWMVDPKSTQLSQEDYKRVQLSKRESTAALKCKEEALKCESNLNDKHGEFWKHISQVKQRVQQIEKKIVRSRQKGYVFV